MTAGSRSLRLVAAGLSLFSLLLPRIPDGIAAGGPDRLDRFRALAASRLGQAQVDDGATAETFREIYGLIDDEIVESLAAGGVFASVAFLQDRLDAFTETWGATVARVMRVGRLTVGAFQPSDGPSGASVRVYGPLADGPGLLEVISHDGTPRLYPLPTAGRSAQFLVAWEGPPSVHGVRPLRIDQFREDRDRVRLVWSTAQAVAGVLLARSYTVNGPEIHVRREVRYPGWVIGCEGQTEEEEVYRLGPGATVFARATRRELDAWHREFHVSVVSRFFAALAAGDHAVLAGLVPDAALRDKLPRMLEATAACDATESAPAGVTGPVDGSGGPASGIATSGAGLRGAATAGDSTMTSTTRRTAAATERRRRVSVAASGAGGPWQLTFEGAAGRWQLIRAQPVLQ